MTCFFFSSGAYCSGKIVSVDVQPPQVITLNETEKKLALIYEKQLEAIGRCVGGYSLCMWVKVEYYSTHDYNINFADDL